MANIFFHYLQDGVRVIKAKKLKSLIQQIFKDHKRPLQRLDYIFCSDNYLLEINNKFLSHNYYTDIITFSFNNQEQPVIGEIYISIERVKENAVIYSVSNKDEMVRVIFHGALHLCGYKDRTIGEKKRMSEKETFFLKRFNVSRNTVSP